MTVSTYAFGSPFPPRPTVTPAAKVRVPVPRQLRARRVMLSIGAACTAAIVGGTAQQVVAHGWKAFVFRAPGVGASPAVDVAAARHAVATPRSIPVASAPTRPTAPGQHTSVRHNHHQPDFGGAPRGLTASASGTTASGPTHHPTIRVAAPSRQPHPPTGPSDGSGLADAGNGGTTTDAPTGDAGDDPVTPPSDPDDPTTTGASTSSDQPPRPPAGQQPPPRRDAPPPRPGTRPPQRGPAPPPDGR